MPHSLEDETIARLDDMGFNFGDCVPGALDSLENLAEREMRPLPEEENFD